MGLCEEAPEVVIGLRHARSSCRTMTWAPECRKQVVPRRDQVRVGAGGRRQVEACEEQPPDNDVKAWMMREVLEPSFSRGMQGAAAG